MRAADRRYFDEQLERVLAAMPPRVHQLLEQVPLYVEDHPSRQTMREMGVRRRDELCGLYTGIPLIERSVEQAGVLSDVVQLFREGIFSAAADARGQVDPRRLREQIRVTLLHELGHHHGLDEDELEQLGYG